MAGAMIQAMRGYDSASSRRGSGPEDAEDLEAVERSGSGSQLTNVSSIPDLANVPAATGHSMLRRRNSFGSQRSGGSGRGSTRYPTRSENYQLITELGLGVTATVYLALCKPLRRKVAVKLLDLEAIELQGGLDVVIKETAVMAGMRHPNVLPLLAAFVEGGSLWMVLPFYPSGSLLSVVQHRHPEGFTDWMGLATVMREVARGLAYMHASGRIHRDLKAANILVSPDGRVALADFGVSAALETTPGHDGALQSQHAPGATQAFDAAAHMRRVSIQQQASAAAARSSTADRAAAEISRSGGSKRMSAAEYRAARRSGKIGPGAPPPLLTQSLGGSRKPNGSEGGEGGASDGSSHGMAQSVSSKLRPMFHNAASAARYLGRSTFVGTPCWMAPEVMAPQVEGYGQAADIWSFGITMLEVATGRAPTARRSVEEILISVLSSPEDDPSSIAGELSHTPEAFQEVVYACLAKNPAERPTAAQLLQMRFFKTMAMDPASLALTLLDNVPPVTQRDDANPPPPPPAPDAQGPHHSGRSLTMSRTVSGSMTHTGSGKGPSAAAADALEMAIALIRQLGRSPLPPRHAKHALPAEELRTARGFGFCVVKRGTFLRAAARGRGFVVARLPSPDGEVEDSTSVCWSAPSWFFSRISASGFTTGNDEVACIFLIRSDTELQAHTAEALAPVRYQDVRSRVLSSCRSLSTAALTELTLSKGGSISADAEANEALYGQGAEAGAILGGRVRPPPAFSALYEELGEVLAGAPLEPEAAGASNSLDTPDAARSVSEGLGRRIEGARFSKPAAGVAGAPAEQQQTAPASQSSNSLRGVNRRAVSYDGQQGAPTLAALDSAACASELESGGEAGVSGAAAPPPRQARPRAATLQEEDLVTALSIVSAGSTPASAFAGYTAAAESEGRVGSAASGRPMLVRLSTSSSAPDLAELAAEGGGGGGSGAVASLLADGPATTDDIQPAAGAGHGFGDLMPPPPRMPAVRTEAKSPRRAAPGPADDTAMDPGSISSWSPGRRPPGGSAEPGSPATPPAHQAQQQQHGSSGSRGDERHPLSPAGSAGGFCGQRAPRGLEPVLEDATLIADLPAHRSAAGSDGVSTPDASIFDIGTLALHSEADAARTAALLDGDESDSQAGEGVVSPGSSISGGGGAPGSGLPPLRRPALGRVSFGGGDAAGAVLSGGNAGGSIGGARHWGGARGELPIPRTPGGSEALRRLAPNPTSASAMPRQHTGGTPPKGAAAGEVDAFKWTFESEPDFAAGSISGRRARPDISLPPRSTLSEADLTDEMLADIMDTEVRSTSSGGAAAGGSSGDGGKDGKGGIKANAVKLGQFLYGSHIPTWGYMPTC